MNCGYSYVDNQIEALGHSQKDLSLVEPTCTNTGLTLGIYCEVCGEKAGDFYINHINSYKTINGFTLKIENFSFELNYDIGRSEKIKQVGVAELKLYVEDGKFGGAVSCTIEVD